MNAQSHVSAVPLDAIISAGIALVVVGLLFTLLFRTYWLWFKKNSKQGVYKIAGKNPTLFDVRELIHRGEKPLAIKVYRQIFKVDLQQAQQAVDDLEKNMYPN